MSIYLYECNTSVSVHGYPVTLINVNQLPNEILCSSKDLLGKLYAVSVAADFKFLHI